MGHHLKAFYSKFENILNDSLSLVKLLGKTKIDNDCFLFTVDFQNLYSNISVKDALELLKRFVFKYQNVIPNAHLIIELIELVLNSAIMEFQKVFYKQILGIVMGTNLAPILANIYMAMLEEELKIICKNKNIKWPIMFKRFIDDGFGIMRGNKKQTCSYNSPFPLRLMN